MPTDGKPRLQPISPDASPAEVAAIIAAIASLQPGVVAPDESTSRSRWLDASRRSARRAGVSRGEWRLSGRIVRRARA